VYVILVWRLLDDFNAYTYLYLHRLDKLYSVVHSKSGNKSLIYATRTKYLPCLEVCTGVCAASLRARPHFRRLTLYHTRCPSWFHRGSITRLCTWDERSRQSSRLECSSFFSV